MENFEIENFMNMYVLDTPLYEKIFWELCLWVSVSSRSPQTTQQATCMEFRMWSFNQN